MAGMKNICGKIPLELHTKVRQEIEQREISTQQFIQQVIEEHFTEKGGQVSMAVRTVAVQVSEELFARFKAAVAKKGCRQKDFLIAIIERAVEEIEAEFGEEKAAAETPPAEPESEPGETESREADEPMKTESGEVDEPMETESGAADEPDETESEGTETGEADGAESGDMPEEESGEPEEPADSEEPGETEEPAGSEEPEETEAGEPEESEKEEASEPETAEADGAGQEPDDTAEVA